MQNKFIPSHFRFDLRTAIRLLLASTLIACQSTGPQTTGQTLPPAAQAQANPSEIQALAARVGQDVVRLQDGADAGRAIMNRLLDAGLLRATSSNVSVQVQTAGVPLRHGPVTPRKGQTQEQAEEMRRQYNLMTAGGYVDGPIDLRFDFAQWHYAFAVQTADPSEAVRPSLHFFDALGDEVHRVEVLPEEGAAVLAQIVAQFKASDTAAPPHPITVKAARPEPTDPADSSIDVATYQQEWRSITDVHQFHGIQQKHGLGREQALRLAPPEAVRALEARQAVRHLLEAAVRDEVPIMAFVSNRGITHIYADVPQAVQQQGEWLLVRGPGESRLKIRTSDIATGWAATRGEVTSVDFFGSDGQPLVTFFGKRLGKEYRITEKWMGLVQALPTQPDAAHSR